ncbi:lactate/malate dehydrogenase, NAD binding domain-containing protein [Phthorimaea operculella]|nr:lactate/malate dehydrogenase, NAD binding domain-containing protein [Phthorimaea operculella]
MCTNKITSLLKLTKYVQASVRSYRVTVVGAASKLGQTVSYLLRNEPRISSLNIYDSSQRVHDVMADLQDIPGEQTDFYAITDPEELHKALQQTDIVISTDGIPDATQFQSQTTDQFSVNATLIHFLAYYLSKLKPMPFIGIATEPINLMVPMAAEIMQRQGRFESRKMFGLTGEDSLRAQVMYGELQKINPVQCSVPVICGHSSSTAVPLLTQATPHRPITAKTAKLFTDTFRQLSQEIHSTNNATHRLGLAFNALLFARAIITTFDMKSKPVIHAFVENNDFGTEYFAGRMRLTLDGVSEMERYTNLSEYECNLLQSSIQKLRTELCEVKKLLKSEDLS